MNPSEITRIIETWSADCTNDNAVLRALLNANACVQDLLLVINGKQPIRPLDSYPISQPVRLEKTLKFSYEDSCDLLNALESFEEVLPQFGVKAELLDGGDGYEEMRLSRM